MSNKGYVCGLPEGCKATCTNRWRLEGIPIEICTAKECPSRKTYTLSPARNRGKKFEETDFKKDAGK